MNAPLPTFDMMTGQQIISQPPVQRQSASMQCDQSNVVHLQLLDRLVVVPSAVVHGPTLRHSVTCPSGQTPTDQQIQVYLLFVTWKNFKPLLEYLSGDAVKLPSGKAELLDLKQTARKLNAREFERLVNRHIKQLYGGGCMGMFSKANLQTSNKQTTTYSSPPKAQREAKPTQLNTIPEQPQFAPMTPQRASTNGMPHSSMQAAPQRLQTAPSQRKQNGTAQEDKQHSSMQSAFPLIKLAPIKTKVLAKKSLFSRVRPARHTRAEKAYNKESGVHLDANAQEQPQIIYDLQRPLIV